MNLKNRPYLEVKVVKVEKDERESRYCFYCGSKIEREEPKGNWVNGENLDKIKFPVPCSYIMDNEKKYGILTSGFPITEKEYLLHSIDIQEGVSVVSRKASLSELIKDYDIHVLKGKIILFEEE